MPGLFDRDRLRSIGRVWSFIFTLSFILTLPFSFAVLPNVSSLLLPGLQAIVQQLGRLWGGTSDQVTFPIYSDSVGMLILAFLLMGLSLLLALLVSWGRHHKNPWWSFASRTIAAYYLSLMLFKYGFDKLFKHQFYLPEPNILFTPLGQLSPDILYWSTMGVSYPYNIFLGIAEILPATLLLFRQTRLIGAMIAMGILLNVFMINWSFGISVKLLSGFLLFLSGVLIAPYLPSLNQLFRKKPTQLPALWRPALDTSRKLGGYTLLKSIAIFLILIEGLSPYWASTNFNDDLAVRPPMHGAYSVLSMQVGDTTYSAPYTPLQRLFVHRNGYFIIQDAQGQLVDFPFRYDPARQQFSLEDSQGMVSIIKHTELTFDSVTHFTLGNQTPYPGAVLKTQVIDWRKLPVFSLPPHWLKYE